MGRVREVLSKPSTWVWVYSTLALGWALLIVPSVLWWKDSVPWLVAMSAYANVAGSLASLQSARADSNSPTAEDLHRVEGKINNLMRRAR